ncbi:MAG: hypothetical protein ABSG52_13305 [Terriglobales bacterium]|jgi:hypothetical protein
MQKFLINRRILLCVAAILLCIPTVEFAQHMPAPPIPTWSGVGSIPKGNERRKVFLSPDEHSVIILWPNPNGTETMRRFDLHNTIYPELRVRIESNFGSFRYRYDLENGKHSKDSLNDFFVVVYPDPQMQTSSALWRGGLSLPTVKERVGIPGAPSGSLADWTGFDEQALQPGATTNFMLITEARPGFTSASTEHFPHLDLTDEWPEEILDQLGPVLDPKWIAYHFMTLGPRYGPHEPEARIASDYLVGIQELIRIHSLKPDSPFVREVIANLDAIFSGSSTQIPITQKPHSEMEAEILSALQLSLHFTYKEPQ